MQIRKIFTRFLVLAVTVLPVTSVQADEANTAVYRQLVDKRVVEVYDKLYSSLEDARFFVVFEANIGNNISRFSKKWGDDYNRNNMTEIRSMVFCNGWYANQVSNLDPDMMGFCPLHLSLIERDGKTTVLFNRPSAVAGDSPAKNLFLKIESEVIAAIKTGLE
jgi:hypothetical protein